MYEDGDELKLYAISSKSRSLYETNIPICGDGIISSEAGEECEGGEHCIEGLCLCEDGYVADENGTCSIKCERNECNCDLDNSCTSCRIEHMDINTRCQDCENGYEFINNTCQIHCGNGIRTGEEDCDGVDHCDQYCKCFNGYKPNGDLNECVLNYNGLLIAWTSLLCICTFALVLFIIIYSAIKFIKSRAQRITLTGNGENTFYACGSITRLKQFKYVESERYPLYNVNNSQFVYSISSDNNFYLQDNTSKPVDKIEVKKAYIFQLFVGNDTVNLASFQFSDLRLDKSDYDLEFTPERGQIRGGDLMCVYGKITPQRECSCKQNFSLTMINLNTSKSYVQDILLQFTTDN